MSIADGGLEMGFKEVVADPFVRSSYRAERVLKEITQGLRIELQGAC